MTYRKILFLLSLLFLISGVAKADDSIKTKVDSIRIQGNESTKAFIILSELTFNVGDLIDSAQLHYNRDRIYSLGIFNQVHLYFDQADTTTLIIDVKEAWYLWPIPFIELVDRDWTKVSYGMDLFIKNFRGLNENFRIRGALGYNPGFRIYYDIPYLLKELGIYASFQGQSDLFNNPNEAAAEEAGRNFDVKHQSGSATVGKRLDNFHWASFTVAVDHFLYPDYVQLNQKKDFTIPSLSVSYRSDTRNLAQFPTEGQLVAAGYTYRGFGFNGFNYGKIAAEYRKYIPLESGFTLKTRAAVQALTGSQYPYHDFVFLGYGEKVRGHFSEQREGS
ncbi:MAG: BamA/TamA family outer membrane protein, partial [Ignavibacteriales bacterium]|nr:BamA/TamA family outer membrane protein [Ignavibacteriales bacterium]